MLKVGVLNAGTLENIHLKAWQDVDQTEVMGFFESDDLVAEQIEQRFSFSRFSDLDYLMDACDLIDITAPGEDCFAWCERAIRKGKHVFIDRTLAASVDEAKELVKLVRESNVKFQVGYAERFNPALSRIQRMELRPRLIDAENLGIVPVKSGSPHPFFNSMVADIDTVLSIVKSDVKGLSAISASVLAATGDVINARIEFYNGCVANVTWGNLPLPPVHTIRFYETGKLLEVDLLTGKTRVLEKGKLRETPDPVSRRTEKNHPAGEQPRNHSARVQLEEFRNAVLNNTSPVVSAIDGLRAMETAYLVLQKIKLNH